MARLEGHVDIFTGEITGEITVGERPRRVVGAGFQAERQYGTAGGWLRGLRGADLRARGQSRGGVGLSGGWR